jgi:hypothetical protein
MYCKLVSEKEFWPIFFDLTVVRKEVRVSGCFNFVVACSSFVRLSGTLSRGDWGWERNDTKQKTHL